MALRRDDRVDDDAEPRPAAEVEPVAARVAGGEDADAAPTTGRATGSQGGGGRVRPEVLALGRRIIASRRDLLDRLAAYDRGETAGR